MAKRVPMYREAQAQVKRYIESNRLRPGDPLPPEGTLAEQLGISRLSMREALKSLEALGIVEARQGNGVYVKAFSFTPILDNLPYSLFVDSKSLGDVLQVREALEEGLLAMTMAKMTSADIERLAAIVGGMAERAATGAGFEDLDRAFHQQLFAPLENPIVLRLIEVFWETYHRLEGNVVPYERDLDHVVRLHAAIVASLRSGDVGAAIDAMRRHFDPVWTRIRGVLPDSPAR